MLDREARRRLHKHLIIEQDRPCSWCGSKENRVIDRIVEGFRGGKYTISNSRVLCDPCHILRHNKRKFAVGDKVIINGRCPAYLIDQIRHNRVRTITAVYYDKEHQCCYYSLGGNHQGASDEIDFYNRTFGFRSYMLHRPLDRGVGRPRQKRQYVRSEKSENGINAIRQYLHRNCTIKHLNQPELPDPVAVSSLPLNPVKTSLDFND